MTITIDRAGRIVIPKEICDRLNLVPGTELEVCLLEDGINLKAASGPSTITEKKGMLVFDGKEKSDIDIADFINQQLNRQHHDVVK